jgi:hypothetical protein
MWNRSGSGKPQQSAASYVRPIARRAVWATGGSRPQDLLAPYKQEVARSSRAPPILTGPLPKPNVCQRERIDSRKPTISGRGRGSRMWRTRSLGPEIPVPGDCCAFALTTQRAKQMAVLERPEHAVVAQRATGVEPSAGRAGPVPAPTLSLRLEL